MACPTRLRLLKSYMTTLPSTPSPTPSAAAQSPLFDVRPTIIPGVSEIRCRQFRDQRGNFAKTFHVDAFNAHGLATDFREEFYSVSHRRVLRGMHFQMPPHEVTKLVFVVQGAIMDVVIDLRVGSPAFGRHVKISLDATIANMVYVPAGMAHGYYVLSESATVVYKMTGTYAPSADTGIAWNSAGIAWPDSSPIISRRDAELASLEAFRSPFIYSQNTAFAAVS